MQRCPKCGSQVDDEMIVCPSCGEELQDIKAQDKPEFVNIHLVRWLQLLALIFPLIGFVMGYFLKKKNYQVVSKSVIKISIVGIALWAMLFFLVFICYIALLLSGISLF